MYFSIDLIWFICYNIHVNHSYSNQHIINCGCEEWPVFSFDKVATRAPQGEFSRGHQCSKIELYRKKGGVAVVYVVKGDLADNIIRNAKNKKKKQSKVEETQEHNSNQEAEVEPLQTNW